MVILITLPAPAIKIAQFLRRVGYTVYAVNPTVSQIDGQPCYASLKDVPEPIDIAWTCFTIKISAERNEQLD